MLSGLFNFLKLQAVNRIRQKAADDRLGNRENRKRLAARAFLEGYEPDPRLFAEGPDDAPDVVVPDPLVGPSETALPPVAPVAPQLVAAGARPSVVGENEYIVRELERIDQNILAIATAMEQNVQSDSQYRQQVIQDQREKLAQRGAARSQRRSKRRRSFFGNLARKAAAPVQVAGGRLREAAKEAGTGLLGFAAINAISEISKRYDEISESVSGFFEDMQKGFNEFVKNVKLFFDIEPEKTTPSPDNTDLPGPTTGNANTRAAIQMIRQVEGTAGEQGYNKVYGGAVVPELTQMNLRELYDAIKLGGTDRLPERLGGGLIPFKKDEYNSSASGAIQLMPDTLKGMVDRGEFSWDDTFDPETQNRMIITLAKNGGVDLTKPLTIEDIKKLNNIWSGLGPRYGQTKRTLEESLSIYRNLLKSLQQNVESNNQQSKKVMVPINAGDPNRNASDPYIYPDGSKLKIGDEVGSLPPVMTIADAIIVDQTTKKTASEGAAMKPGFDIASLVLDPSTGISEYAPMLGVG